MKPKARRPVPAISASAAATPSGLRSQIATSAPARASASAMARPIPCAPPVTNATRCPVLPVLI